MKTQEEILLDILPVIQMHRAAGEDIEITKDANHIKVEDTFGAFGGQFIRDFAAVCVENYIGFSIGAKDNRPYILL